MGAIGWFARNSVAANLIMVLVLVGGTVSVFSIKQEVFPEFSLDLITVTVPYLGAAPEEVEEGVCVRVEEAIQGLDGIKKIKSTASEGIGVVSVELLLGADARQVLDDVKSRVDAIETFPEETEKPIIREITNRRQVIDIAVHGDADERTLRVLADQVRDEVSALPGITLVEIGNDRPYEVSIEVSEDDLRRHGITFDFVANAVRRSSLDLPGGSVKTAGGEILLRTKGQAYRKREFERLALWTRSDGSELRLGDVADVVDGFAETDQMLRFDGQQGVLVNVFRVGDQDALGISAIVKEYVAGAQLRMPEGVELTTWNDFSTVLRGRRDLLIKNGIAGLGLVFFSLALFLRFRLAFWVALGLAIAFMGTLAVMPWLDVSVNVISLFAFILVLGIVVDDAIIVGENIYTHQHRDGKGLEGSISGAQEISLPVVFAVLTTVAAFLPLLNIEGNTGKIMRVIPLIVIPCLLWSLVESLWILPAHLSHYRHDKKRSNGPWRRFQSAFANGLQWFVRTVYRPALEFGLEWRYLTAAVGIATLLVTIGLAAGGYVGFIFFPDVEADFISAAITLPPGTPVETTSQAVGQLERGIEQMRTEARERTGQDPVRHLAAAIGEQPFRQVQRQNSGGDPTREVFSHIAEVTVELVPAEERLSASGNLSKRWRELTGPIPDAIETSFSSTLFSPGADIEVQLTGRSIDELRTAAEKLKERLGEFAGTFDITDSFREGKRELKLDIKREAELLGLTQADLGRQVRQAFYGEEAQRIQRGRDDVRVMVRYPEDQRKTVADLEQMRIRTPDGREVPFSEVARVQRGRGYATIRRVDSRRSINVTSDVDTNIAQPNEIIAELQASVLPAITAEYPGIAYSFEGQEAEQRDTMRGLAKGFAVAAVMIFGLLAIPLRSYVQPLLIMSAIPFGFVGAVWGHLILGLNLTILSMFGLVALTGVVVNDSLVMVDKINRYVQRGLPVAKAVREAGAARFRPILLTSLTTFLGLSPLMLEKSMQAQFLIPMAVSLAFGVVFATFITLVLVPSGYMILEDVRALPARLRGRRHVPLAASTKPSTDAPGPGSVEGARP